MCGGGFPLLVKFFGCQSQWRCGIISVMKRTVFSNPLFIGGLGLLIIILGVAAWWLWPKPSVDTPSTAAHNAALKSGEGKDYDVLTKDELAARTKERTGHSLEVLTQEPITDTTFKTADQAIAAASALAAVDKPAKGLEAYQQAEHLTPEDNQTMDFYAHYREIADQAGNIALGTEMLRKELALAIKQGDHLVIEKLKLKLEVREREAKQ